MISTNSNWNFSDSHLWILSVGTTLASVVLLLKYFKQKKKKKQDEERVCFIYFKNCLLLLFHIEK
jgi:uncharacterized membrane protein